MDSVDFKQSTDEVRMGPALGLRDVTSTRKIGLSDSRSSKIVLPIVAWTPPVIHHASWTDIPAATTRGF